MRPGPIHGALRGNKSQLGIPQIKVNGNFLPVSNTDNLGLVRGTVKK
jgi:hypothetical protein